MQGFPAQETKTQVDGVVESLESVMGTGPGGSSALSEHTTVVIFLVFLVVTSAFYRWEGKGLFHFSS